MDIRSFFSRPKASKAAKAQAAKVPPKTPAPGGQASSKTPSTANVDKRSAGGAPGSVTKVGSENSNAANTNAAGGLPQERAKAPQAPLFPDDESEQEMEMDDESPSSASSGSVSSMSGKRKRVQVPTQADKDFIVNDDVVEYLDGAGDDNDDEDTAMEKQEKGKETPAPEQTPAPRKRKKKVAAKAQVSSRKRPSDASDSRRRSSDASESVDLDNAKKSKREAAKKGQNAFSFMKAAQRRSAKAPAQKAKAKSKTESKPRVKSSKQANPYKYNVSSHGQSLKSQKWSAERAKELPAMTEPQEMFDDMVGKMPALKGVAKRLGTKPLTVATMCSGTEAPMLALEMVSKAAKKIHGINIAVKSVFSCEIEEYKQAYIERNFAPPILFRDAEQLQFDIATTAYGSETAVPGGVDILIAGTSCKDASSLNNHKQDLRFGSGESTRTYRGMLGWVTKHLPAFVVLENVCGAPWELMCSDFDEIGYQATYRQDLDTKKYYCPQTRTRGYLVAMRTTNKSAGLRWNEEMVRLERQSSSTIEAFLLENDDPRVLAARNAKWTESKRIEWTRCQSRHTRERFEGGLGERRPVTNWIETGQCVTPNHWWRGFINQQTHRVHDTIDTNFLRQAVKRSRDSTYKAEVWDLSQNVDRQSFPPDGLTGCLTPSGCAFLTCRGGPIIGVETLKLQGLPVDDIMLSCESEPQLRDFAGNAMTTTVVGAAMLCAFAVAAESLHGPGHMDNTEEDEARYAAEAAASADQASAASAAATGMLHGGMRKLTCTDVQPNNNIEWTAIPMDLGAPAGGVDVAAIVTAAAKSAQACHSEGRFDVCPLVRRCKSCHASVSIKEAPRINENHLHDREPDMEITSAMRVKPVVFMRMFKEALPMRLQIAGFGGVAGMANLQAARDAHPSSALKCRVWKKWTTIVTKALDGNEFRFAGISRAQEWTASYRYAASDGAVARLLLTLAPSQRYANIESGNGSVAAWTLTVEPPPEVVGPIRVLLSQPIARMTVDASTAAGATQLVGCTTTSLSSAKWELRLPLDHAFKVTVNQAEGASKVAAWKASLGLKEHLNDKRLSAYTVAVPEEDKAFLARDISGTYTLLPSCEAAEDSLYIRSRGDDHEGESASSRCNDLYLFVDPEKCGPAEEDHMVFSESNRRLAYGETRPVIALLDPSWRPSLIRNTASGQTLACKTSGIWVAADFPTVAAVGSAGATVDVPPSGAAAGATAGAAASSAARVELTPTAHETPTLVASCSVPARADGDSTFESLLRTSRANEIVPVETKGGEKTNWVTIKARSKTAFKDVKWLTTRVEIPKTFDAWHELLLPAGILQSAPGSSPNEVCAPTPPELQFVLVKNKLVARENPTQAGEYEKSLKNRPDTFLVQISSGSSAGCDGKDSLRVGVNVAALASQTIMQLPPHLPRDNLKVSWRLVPNNGGGGANGDVAFPRLKLLSCRAETAAEQPPNFGKYPLRPEQLRSLAWMQKQEATDAPYFEMALEESVLNALDWRAECKAEIPVSIKGGILGDQVGYGKTAITLAMIDSSRVADKDLPSIASAGSRIPTRCTLIVVPSHLPNQWALEVKKFVGAALKTRVVKNLAHLNGLSIADIQNLDVLIVSETLLRTSDEYWYRLACLSGAGRLPPCRPTKTSGGVDRRFAIAYKKILAGLGERVVEMSASEEESSAKSAPTSPSSSSSAAGSSSGAGEGSGVQKVVHAMKHAVEVLKENQKTFYVAPEVLHGKDLRETARLEGEWMKSLDKAQRAQEEKKKATSKRLEAQAERRRNEEKKKIEKALKGIKKDPWKLQSSEVRRDWRKIKCPPLEMFHWNRVVVDEFTYLDKRSRAALHLGIKGTNRWALSGTPPIADFGDVKSIAASIGVHLGVNGHVDLKSETTTALEKLQHFQNTRSPAWKAARHGTAQKFLDRFVRQNIAEIDEIHAKEYIWHTQVTAAEKAVYLELKHHLEAMDMNVKGGFRKKTVKKQSRTAGKPKDSTATVAVSSSSAKSAEMNDESDAEDGAGANDKDTRMAAVLQNCKSAEEALIKRAATFDLEGEHASAQEECAAIAEQRGRQLGAAKLDFISQVRKAFGMRQALMQHDRKEAEARLQRKGSGLQLLREWLANEQIKGDAEADEMLSGLVRTARENGPRAMKQWVSGFAKLKSGSQKDTAGNTMADRDWALREHIHHLRRLQKEILDRVRSLRYFKAVRIVQDPASVVKCASDGSVVALENRALLSCCGHQGHKDILRSFAGNNACPAAGCTAPVRPKSVVLASDLGASTADASSKAGSHGSKLGKLCTMLKTLPQDERVLVFVQFGDLMEKVKLAIEDLAGLKTSSLKGSSSQKTKVLTAFQACDDDVSSSDSKNDVRVLLLNLADESASGANLTTANHLVFVHPLYAESQQKWAQQEAQAVGRVRRYGQKREVKVHRFIVDDSIDSEILDSMERDYIGPVVHIHASVSSMSEEFEAAVRTACAANPGLRELTYPISGGQ